MMVWIIEPRDPLIARDGRPFGPVPGARARSLAFPFPSTTTGGVRTRAGLDKSGRFVADIQKVKNIQVRGPFLVELDAIEGDIAEWLAPAPADALLLSPEPDDAGRATLKRLVPLKLPEGAQTDLPPELSLVGLPRRDPRKPFGAAPRYWRWPFFEMWLKRPEDQEISLSELGHDGPVLEARMHVGINPATQTADEEKGALFQTRGLEFTRAESPQALRSVGRLGLAVAAGTSCLQPGIAPLGGERRLVFWRPSSKDLPALPDPIKEKIVKRHCCRIILLTPAHFQNGWKPTWLLTPRQGVRPLLQAASLNRAEVVSGWDFEHDKPKPTRRLAPAGSVFFLRLEGTDADVAAWLDGIWMQAVSDREQDRRDGFGLAAVGFWDGTFSQLEV